MSADEEYPVWYEPKFFKKIPTNLHEKYVEAWKHFSGSGLKHCDIQKFANADWHVQSMDEKHELVRKHVRQIKAKGPKKTRSLFDCGFVKKASPANVSDQVIGLELTNSGSARLDTVPSASAASNEAASSMTVNVSNATNEELLRAGERSTIERFLTKIHVRCPELLKDPGADKSQFLMSSLLATAQSYANISDLLSKYEGSKKKSRNSKLSETISSLYKQLEDIKVTIISALETKTDAALGYRILSKNAEKKESLFKDIALKCQILKSFICENGIRRSLNRRVNQMDTVQSEISAGKMLCFNDTNLTWHEAFANLTSDVNCYDMDVYNIGMMMKDSAAVEVSLLLSQARNAKKDLLKRLLMTFPLLLLMKKNAEKYVINLHQTSNNCTEVNELLIVTEEKQTDNSECAHSQNTKTSKGGSKPGPKPVEEKFPDISVTATEFIKRNGYKASEKRRDDDIISCGVSVEEVRDHLLENIPGLAEHGLSSTTCRYLFKAVNKSLNTSKRYKGVVQCRVPAKDNSGRVSNKNSHFLHSRVNMRLEQAFLYDKEHIVFSADAMNKILVGDVLCVSRYHQIRRLFMVDDKPKTKDHDFPMGYKIIPCGKMILLKRGDTLSDIFGDNLETEMDVISAEDLYEYDNVEVDTGYDTDGCISSDSPHADPKEIDADTPEEPRQNHDIKNGDYVEYKKDKLGRDHIKFPRTGPILVFNRNAQFHSQTMEAHSCDFFPLFKTAVEKGRSCIVCVVDNGPDMDPTNYINEYNIGRLWEDAGADMIVVTSYAAGQSAYNMIEHAWSPLSNRLTLVKLPAVLDGEEKPPNKQTNITEDERKEKEKLMLDKAADVLAQHWRGCTFDGHVVVPITVSSANEEDRIYNDQNELLRFLSAPLRDFNSDKTLQRMRLKFKFFAKHAVRRQNEFVIMKCQFFKSSGLECGYCQRNPPTAKETLQLLKKFKGKMVQPVPSEQNPGHFLTFLETISLTELPTEDTGELGKCMICPNWTFTSKTEQEKHRKLFHPKSKASHVVPLESQIHRCSYKVNNKVCGESFQSRHMLFKHKQNMGHIKKRGAAAKKDFEEAQRKKRKLSQDRSVAKKVITRNGFSSDEESSAEEREEFEEEEESEMDDDELEVESEDEEEADETEEVDDNDCNARPCSIGSIIKRKNENVAWVRCSACPKWFHQFCVDVSDDDLTFKCHNH